MSKQRSGAALRIMGKDLDIDEISNKLLPILLTGIKLALSTDTASHTLVICGCSNRH
jgi:hypothetical protein